MDQASASPAASCAHNPAAPRTLPSWQPFEDQAQTVGPPPAHSSPRSEPHSEPVHIVPRPSSPALCQSDAKGYLLPDFYSGCAIGISGRLTEGLLLWRSHVRLGRRDLVWINVTTNPTAEWIARQLTEAFPWNEVPRYLIRDRDRIYGTVVTRRIRAMGIRDKPTAPASPWQNGFAERLIGSIRRECVDHIVVLGEAHLRRILRSYARYYNDIRTHRSLDKDAPVSRPVQWTGIINSHAVLGGLHHHYVRI